MLSMRRCRTVSMVALTLALTLLFGCSQNEPNPMGTATQTSVTAGLNGAPLSGAIFTTTVDGSIVNENVHYTAKEDVYLDGGPGPNAPPGAAGLPEGDYYFQVTDPSGKDLLSTDHISCRRIHINEHGVIDMVYPGTNYEKDKGDWVPVACQHNQGVDVDHSELGAITVQLFPYDDTPNKGGVYKVWITPVDQYTGDPNYVPDKMNDPVNGENYQPGNFHGFVPRWCKTDNYKVRERVVGPPPCPAPEITLKKFHDANLNGVQDMGEEDITGWAVDVTDPLGVSGTEYTTETILATGDPGDVYTFEEETPSGTVQTASYLDGVILSQYPTADPTVYVTIAAECGETHEVVYGNAGLGSVTACKYFDRNADGVVDEDEPPVAGFAMSLSGTDLFGNVVGPLVQYTGEDGCTTFSGLLPGMYTISEVIPAGWVATGPTSYDFEVVSTLNGSTVSGGDFSYDFTNVCFGEADFGTKGYWHNKNGLQELTDTFIAEVNMLDPYDDPTSYFGAGDEPFDGFFADATPVAAAFNNDDMSLIWGEGTWQAEVSHFLVDANAGGDPREQLAQQLLAFIFNVEYRLGGTDATIELPDMTLVNAGDLIDEAIDVWANGTAMEQNAMQELLDGLNNNDAVHFVPGGPCDVVYP